MDYLNLLKLYISGRKKTAIFAINTACTCKCAMCSVWQKKPEFMNLETGKKIIDKLKKEKFGLISFTGGEPLLNPNYDKFVSYAKKQDFLTHSPTNGTLLTEKKVKALKKDGLDLLTISLDTSNEKIHDKIRGHLGCFKKAIKGVELCKKHGIATGVTTFINVYNHNIIEDHIKFITKDLGVPIGICFPETSPNKEYFADKSKVLEITREQLKDTFKKILDMKKQGYPIMNTYVFFEEAIKFLGGEKVLCSCSAGKDVYFLDWNGDVHPCFMKPKLFRWDEKFTESITGCNKCFVQCFREPALVSYLFKTRPWKLFRELEFLKYI